MAKRPTCFIISPIGEVGSTTRNNADDLLQMIIEPALEIYDFRITRGDHRNDNGQIDVDVIRSVQEADICICDLSESNPNVYYELGRRDECGKPVVLMMGMNGPRLPVDIATRRYIEYDLDSRHGPRDAQKKLREAVEPYLDAGFEASNKVTLDQVAATLSRLERKVDRLGEGGSVKRTDSSNSDFDGMDRNQLRQKFKLAMIQKDPATAEKVMYAMEKFVERTVWLDVFVEQATAVGSIEAGKLLLGAAREFMDSGATYRQKTQYLGIMTTFIARQNLEPDYYEVIDEYVRELTINDEAEDEADRISVRNQPQRLYYGMYLATEDIQWLSKSKERLLKCLQIGERDFLYYNLAMVERKLAEVGPEEDRGEHLENAKQCIDNCLRLDGADDLDSDHLELACKIYHSLGLPETDDLLDRLETVNSTAAILLRRELKL